MDNSINNEVIKNNKAHIINIGLFSLNNTATNSYLMLLNLASYYTFGNAGLLMSVLLNIATIMRIFDGFTDPIIGTLIDRCHKYGKCRPFIILGQIIMLISVLTLYLGVNHISNTILAYVCFIILYAIYIIGYTAQSAITKVGQAILTNDPKQRPLFSLFDSIFNTILFTTYSIIMPMLATKFGGIANQNMFNTMMQIFIPISIISSLLAIVGLWEKDNDNYFIKNKEKVRFKDFIPVIKHNQAIKMLMVSAATNKLSTTICTHTLITTLLFAVILGNYTLSSQISIALSITTIIVIFIFTSISRRHGQKQALVLANILAIIGMIIFLIIMILINPMGNKLELFSVKGIIFVIGYILSKLGISITSSIVIPMIADCTDYETYLSRKFIPGLMATLFSFVDKLVSSISTTLLSILFVIAIGKDGIIDTSTTYVTALFIVFIVAYIILPIISFIITLISMKFYPLNKEMMKIIELKVNKLRIEGENDGK